jgi:NADH:ubiquinone oxidoreductase subunit D
MQQHSLTGFQKIMEKHEEIRKSFAILRQAIDTAEQEFSAKYQQIIAGIEITQEQDSVAIANIAQSFAALGKNLESLTKK